MHFLITNLEIDNESLKEIENLFEKVKKRKLPTEEEIKDLSLIEKFIYNICNECEDFCTIIFMQDVPPRLLKETLYISYAESMLQLSCFVYTKDCCNDKIN
ncbi:hypothetical protein V6O07_04610 [Arthrospira platensis SPKY2]